MAKSIDWVAYKPQTFISHSSGNCEVWDQGVSMVGFWWGLYWLADSTKRKLALLRVLISFTRTPPPQLNCFLKASPPNNVILKIRFQQMNLGEGEGKWHKPSVHNSRTRLC
jgi:hypothetical protein